MTYCQIHGGKTPCPRCATAERLVPKFNWSAPEDHQNEIPFGKEPCICGRAPWCSTKPRTSCPMVQQIIKAAEPEGHQVTCGWCSETYLEGGMHVCRHKAEMPSASFIAGEAARLVSDNRAATHGGKLINHQNIAALWQAYLYRKQENNKTGPAWNVSALDVANMMELLKIARRLAGKHNLDDYIDGAGYAAVGGEIAEILEATAHNPGTP